MKTIPVQELRDSMAKIFSQVGVPEEDARIISEALAFADLRGISTHGVRTVSNYCRRFVAGSMNPKANLTIVSDSPTMAIIDGDNGLGHLIGFRCMTLAINKAKENGIGLVAARNSNHFGMTAYYSMMAQKQGMIGAACSNASARLAPTGGKEAKYGNNPWTLAFPCEEGEIPLVVDMANSVVANSHIIIAKAKGTKIPFGWALTSDGEPTDDPNNVGTLLPFGGYKGYGLALAIEALTSVLSGAAIGREAGEYNSMVCGQNLGHFFLAIDIGKITDVSEYRKRLTSFLNDVRSSALAKGSSQVMIPGEKEYFTLLERSRDGVPVDDLTLNDLIKLQNDLKIDTTL